MFDRLILTLVQGGYGFVAFESSLDARDAVRDLDGCKLKSQLVRLELSTGGRDRRRGDRSSERVLERGKRRRRRSNSGSEVF